MTTTPTLHYHDASADRNSSRPRWLAVLASLMALAAVAVVVWYQRETWGAAARNPVLDIICVMTVAGALVGLARALGSSSIYVARFTWIGLATDFGFWTVILLSNQSHGRPPASDRLVLGGCVICLALSAFGLALDQRVRFENKKADGEHSPSAKV